MKKFTLFLYVTGFLMLGNTLASAGSTTLSTYYPAPDGNYNKLTTNYESIGLPINVAARLLITGSGAGYAAFNDGGCGGTYTGFSLNGSIPAAGCTTYNFLSDPTDNYLYINRPTGAEMHFREGNAFEQMVLAKSTIAGTPGNVGIGVAPGAANLDVNGYLHVSGNTAPTTTTQGGYLGWNALTGGTGEMDFINNEGGGSGGFAFMNTPAAGAPRTTSVTINGGTGMLTDTDSSGYYTQLANTTWSVYGSGTVGTANSNGWWAGYFTSNAEGLYASDASGYWAKLAPNNSWSVEGNGTIGTTNGNGWYAGYFVSSGGAALFAQDGSGTWTQLGNNAGYGVVTTGMMWATGTITSSDQRLKKDILPLTGALDKIQLLNGVSFTWKKSGTKDIGVIAQDVEKVLPEIVTTGKDGMKGVEYGNMAALFIEAIKEQQKEIKDQQKEIDELEKKIGGNK